MTWRGTTIATALALAMALGAAAPAEAGFWGDLRGSFGTAVDNAERDGAEVIDAITGDDGNAAVEGADSAPESPAPETAEAPVARPLDGTAGPVTAESKQLSKQPRK